MFELGIGAVGHAGVLVTDGGTHPPEKFARAAAEQLVLIEATASDEGKVKGEKMRAAVAASLVDVFARVKREERDRLKRYGRRQLGKTVTFGAAVAAGTSEVLQALQISQPSGLVPIIQRVLAKCFAGVIQNERDWWQANEKASPSD